MPKTIEFAVEEGDILQYKADIIALKYAQSFYGPTQTVRARLDKLGVMEEWFQPMPDTFVLQHSRGTAAAEFLHSLCIQPTRFAPQSTRRSHALTRCARSARLMPIVGRLPNPSSVVLHKPRADRILCHERAYLHVSTTKPIGMRETHTADASWRSSWQSRQKDSSNPKPMNLPLN
jgi:hypothetical protein